jgi:hypothetical protein
MEIEAVDVRLQVTSAFEPWCARIGADARERRTRASAQCAAPADRGRVARRQQRRLVAESVCGLLLLLRRCAAREVAQDSLPDRDKQLGNGVVARRRGGMKG